MSQADTFLRHATCGTVSNVHMEWYNGKGFQNRLLNAREVAVTVVPWPGALVQILRFETLAR
jgi:hypothetical protein